MQHFGAGGGNELGETLAAKLGGVNHALPAAFGKLLKGLLEAGCGGDHAVLPGAGVLVSLPVQGRHNAFTELGGLFQHRLGGIKIKVFKTGQCVHGVEAREFLHSEQHVFQGGLVTHGVLSIK